MTVYVVLPFLEIVLLVGLAVIEKVPLLTTRVTLAVCVRGPLVPSIVSG